MLKHKRKFILGLLIILILAVGVTLAVVTFRHQRQPPENGSKTDQLKSETTEPYERFHGVEVAAKQILFKLDRCSADASLPAQMTKFTRELTKDDSLVVKQIGNQCLFLARSSKLTVAQLLDAFKDKPKVNQLLLTFNVSANVVYAEPDFVARRKPNPSDGPVISCSEKKEVRPPNRPSEPNDDYFQRRCLWGLKNPKVLGLDIGAVPAWQQSTGSPSIAVGVIDSGFYYDHQDLKDNVWQAPENFDITLGTETIHCLAGSHGYNAMASPPDPSTPDPNALDPRCDPSDEDGHGTHVAGIIGARGNNDIGVVGVNWQTKLIALEDGPLISDKVKTIQFAIALKARFPAAANLRVLNASWGYYGEKGEPDTESQSLKDAISSANDNDMLFVASAGEDFSNDNDDRPYYPASFDLPNVISVTAIDGTGALAMNCNQGVNTVHLAAPGAIIYSTYPTVFAPNGYFQKNGTSMAAAFVSGAAALILSVPACAQLDTAGLKNAILAGVTTTRVPMQTVTHGLLNVNRSIERCRANREF